MNLSHLYSLDFTTSKLKIRSQLQSTPEPEPVNFRVTVLAVMITQLSSDNSVNTSYMNNITDDEYDKQTEMHQYCMECSE